MNKFKKLIITLIFLPVCAMAQTEGEDLIELKNGTIHQGIVIEQKPGKHIRLLQLPSRDTLTFMVTEIEAMRKMVVIDTDEASNIDTSGNEVAEKPEAEIPKKERGFNQRRIHTEINYGGTGGDWSSQTLGAKMFYTYKHNIQLGLGVSLFGESGLSLNNPLSQVVPLTLQGRYTIKEWWKQRNSLIFDLALGYHFVDGGYSTSADGSPAPYARLKNGLYFSPSLGYRINPGRDTGFILSVGYQLINTAAKLDDGTLINRHNYSSLLGTVTFFF